MSATLASIAEDLETASGASTSANVSESGYWLRIATAAETLAGAVTTANSTLFGYMKRTAVALESIAGTSGAEENANEAGYKKRIVDALEVQAGAVTVGSLDYRMKLGAQNAVFEEATATWPFVGMGAEANWAFGGDGDARWESGSVAFVDTFDPTETASLTGAAVATFDAAVSNNTAITITITIADYDISVGSDVQVSVKGGAFANFDVTGDGVFDAAVISGSGSGFVLRPKATSSFTGFISSVEIELT